MTDSKLRPFTYLVMAILLTALVAFGLPVSAFADSTITEQRKDASLFACSDDVPCVEPITSSMQFDDARILMSPSSATAYDRIASTIAMGEAHSAAVKQDGSLWVWGDNSYYELGDDTMTHSLIPVKLMDGVVSVSLGRRCSAAVKSDGTLWTWGRNDVGQVGDGTTLDRRSPVMVMDGVVAVSLGSRHSAAIKSDGSLWTWGNNHNGQLGDGTYYKRQSPVKVLDSVVALSMGDNHSAAIKSDGSLWTWGKNANGELGDGTTTEHSSPVKVMDGVVAVSLGGGFSAAIKSDGSLWMWGSNASGRLGDGTTTDRHSPVKVMDDVVAVSLGSWVSAAVKSDGSLWTWGVNEFGQLGDGTTTDRHSPVKVMDDVVAASLGLRHSAAVKSDGSLWTWGINPEGRLGDGTKTERYKPVRVMDGLATGGLAPVPPSGDTYDISSASVYIANTHSTANPKVTWTGSPVEPEVSVQYSNGEPLGIELQKDVDYTVSYSDNTDLGTATATITGIGQYTGSKTVEFRIVPGNALANQSEFTLDDVWGFRNSNQSIPLKHFHRLFGPIWGWAFYFTMNKGYSRGVCYGMVASAIASHEYSFPAASSYRGDGKVASTLSDVGMDWTSSSLGMSAIDMVMCAHVSRHDPSVVREFKEHENDLTGLANAVLRSVGSDGEPVSIFVGKEGAHELLAAGIGDNSSLCTEIRVYDCNWAPEDEDWARDYGVGFGSLYLYKDSAENYVSWKYTPYWFSPDNEEKTFSSSSQNKNLITWCTPGDTLEPMLARNGSYHPDEDDVTLLITDSVSDDVTIDFSGGTVTLSEGYGDLVVHVYDIDDSADSSSAYESPSVNWLYVGDSYTISNVSEDASFTAASETGGMSFRVAGGGSADVSLSEDKGRGVTLSQGAGSRFEVEFFEESTGETPCLTSVSGVGGRSVRVIQKGGTIELVGVTELTVTNDGGVSTSASGLDGETTYVVSPGDAGNAPTIKKSSTVAVYRMYNRVSSEHLYTTVKAEYDRSGTGAYRDWDKEGVAWYAPATGTPVWRLYNAGLGDHHYTASQAEADLLVSRHGWTSEGVIFYSGGTVPVYRLYNGGLRHGQHHLTASLGEVAGLTAYHGWKDEGVGLHCVSLAQ